MPTGPHGNARPRLKNTVTISQCARIRTRFVDAAQRADRPVVCAGGGPEPAKRGIARALSCDLCVRPASHMAIVAAAASMQPSTGHSCAYRHHSLQS